MILLKRIFLLLTIVFASNLLMAQTVWENPNARVYTYLFRMAQKGLVVFDDAIQPATRTQITNALNTLTNNQNKLTEIERKELSFYLQEYNALINDTTTINILVKDKYKRPRFFSIESKDFNLKVDPIVGDKLILGNGNNINQVSNGVQLWGTAGKHWGYQLFYRDYTETGTVRNYYNVKGLSFTREEPTTGFVIVGLNDDHKINYSEVRANITYTFNKGMLSFGKDRMLWGYGETGRIVLDQKTPS
jgi:hypothetical protein